MTKALLSLILSALLVMTSHTGALARSGERAVDQMVICIGLETAVIYVDADGNPTRAPHHCPDCALHVLAAPVVAVSVPVRLSHGAKRLGLRQMSLSGLALRGQNLARAPPVVL